MENNQAIIRHSDGALMENDNPMENHRMVVDSLLDAVPHAVIGMKNRTIAFANPAVHSVFGWHPEELIGKNTRILYCDDDGYEEIGRNFYFMLVGQRTFRQEFACRRKDGKDIICKVSASRVGDNLKDKMIVVTYEDISEQKRADMVVARSQEEMAILVQKRTLELQKTYAELARETAMHAAEAAFRREAEERYRLFINGTDDIVFMKDDKLRYVFVNRAACDLFAKDESDIIGKTDFQLMPENAARICQDSDEQALKADGVVVAEEVWGERTFESRKFRLNLMDGKIGIGAFIRETTRQKRLENQLMQAQKMEAVGTLAGGIAHDFNNLLMGIQGHASLMLMDVDADHPHYTRLQGIQDQVQSGASLTRQLLGFARGGGYEIKPTDITHLVRKTSSMFGRTRKEIQIQENYTDGVWNINVDQTQMEQVLLNLYVNAWQAMPAGGVLYLETENICVSQDSLESFPRKAGNYVKITVKDTGVGMDDNTRRRIFEPFFTTKEMGRGTGLGLATVYGIIKGHGGYIDVASEEGKGTCFHIYLPAIHGKAARDFKTEGRILKGRETILLVDDEAVIMDVTRDILEALGYHVLTAAGGRKAVKMYAEAAGRIDLVILDMIMPEMGGGETFDRLKAINPEIKVILSSGYSLNSQARTIMDKGVQAFLQKPFRIDQLSQKVRDVLGK